MTIDLPLRIIAVPVLLGLGLAGFAVTGGQASANGPTVCGINANTSGGMIALEAAFQSDTDANGSYQFRVMSSGSGGSSNISQGGAFAAKANDRVTLGQVSINAGSTYQVELTVNANGVDHDCSKDIAAR